MTGLARVPVRSLVSERGLEVGSMDMSEVEDNELRYELFESLQVLV